MASFWLIAVAISWPMAIFYHDPQLKYLLPVLSLMILIGGFNSTNLLSLSRHMRVRRLFGIDGSTAVVSLIVTVIWAYFWPIGVVDRRRSGNLVFLSSGSQPHSIGCARHPQLASLGKSVSSWHCAFWKVDHGRNGLFLLCLSGRSFDPR